MSKWHGIPSRDRSDGPSATAAHPGNFAPLITGIAVGGPRNGIRLSCPSSWDGRIIKRTDTVGKKHHYAGHYELHMDNGKATWAWVHELH